MAHNRILVKILGDHHFSEFISHVKVSEVLGMTHSFTQVTTMSTLSLEMDANGPENITVLCCMTTLFESTLGDETGALFGQFLDKLRMILDGYLISSHDLYYCPPLSRPPGRETIWYTTNYDKLRVRY